MTNKIALYSGIWLGGKKMMIDPNVTYTYPYVTDWWMQARSMVVPSGAKCRILGGMQGDGNKSLWFEAGTYHDLSFWRMASYKEAPFVIESAVVDYDADSLMCLYNGTSQIQHGDYSDYQAYYNMPAGKHNESNKDNSTGRFEKDKSKSIYIPKIANATAYENKDEGGKYVALGEGFHQLSTYGFVNKISSMSLEADELEWVKTDLDWDNADMGTPEKTVIVKMKSHNCGVNASSSLVSLSRTEWLSQSWSYNITGGISATVGVKGNIGIPVVAKGEISASMTASLTAGFGQSGTAQTQTTIAASSNVEMQPNTVSEMSLVCDFSKVKVKATRTFKSVRTGELVTDSSWINSDQAGTGDIDVESREINETDHFASEGMEEIT